LGVPNFLNDYKKYFINKQIFLDLCFWWGCWNCYFEWSNAPFRHTSTKLDFVYLG